MTTAPQEDKRHTACGTPCARAWSGDWVAEVDATEARLGRRICGARTLSGTPCLLESNHSTGRCRFHGGFALTGAPKGNRNAVLHGLYSRRLQVCGPHCAQWETCPLAGQDVVEAGRLESEDGGAGPSLLTCPYEQAEYNAVVTDGLARVEAHGDAFDRHQVHMAALLQVMVSRAAGALNKVSLIETSVVESGGFRQEFSRIHTYLQAFLRLQREYQRVRKSLDDACPRYPRIESTDPIRVAKPHAARLINAGKTMSVPQGPLVESVLRHEQRAAHDTDLDLDAQDALYAPESPAHTHAERELARAVMYGGQGRDVAMLDAMERAYELDPEYVLREEARVLGSYRPDGQSLPEGAVKEILKTIKGVPEEP